MNESYKILQKYFTTEMSSFIIKQIDEHNIYLKITPERLSKRGDYKHPYNGLPHQISLNKDDNKYRMLLTWIHEYAHLLTWVKYKNIVKAHGIEWKNSFRFVLLDAMTINLFPADIDKQLYLQFLKKETFTGQINTELETVLRKYDNITSLILNEIPLGTKFKIKNGMIFLKGEKLRKRYKCIEINTGKVYTIHGFADVEIIN